MADIPPRASTRPPDPSLDEWWRRSAEGSSDARLAALAAVGALAVAIAGAIALGVVPGRLARWWPVLLPGVAAGGFGLWGIAARTEEELGAVGAISPWMLATLTALRWLGALAAALALGVALVLLLALALGTRTPGG